MAGPIQQWLSAALAFIYPELCQICREARAGPRESFVCKSCRETIRRVEPPFCEICGLPYPGDITGSFQCSNCGDRKFHFTYARSAIIARNAALEAIHLYKYGKALWVEPLLAELLVSRAAPELQAAGWDALVPVPLHPTREREREFNQAARLADHLSKASGIPLKRSILRRLNPTRTQTKLDRKAREENMRNAFALAADRDAVKDLRLVVVDDVFTTGATTNECARVLKRAGAAEVCIWTLARGT